MPPPPTPHASSPGHDGVSVTGSGSSGDAHGTTAVVGMVGGGQLARMTQRAAIDLGIRLEVLALGADEPAVLAGAVSHIGGPDDLAALRGLAEAVEVVTLDHELVNAGHLAALVAAGHRVHPGPDALRFAQDKLHARTRLAALGFPVPAFRSVANAADVTAFAAVHAWPVVLKARTGGYDGRGVEVVGDADAAASVLARGGGWLVEALVPIATEVSVVTARRPGGAHVTYPVVETVQDQGICVELVMPARVPPAVASRATDLAEAIAEAIGAVGILAVELFVTAPGEVVVNEVATRPHNSGHATIEGSVTSQFTNHLRAVLDWPLGDTAMRAPVAATVNLLGGSVPTDLADRLPRALVDGRVHVHLYGKEPRPGRKIGHVTVLGDDAEHALAAARRAADLLVSPEEAPT